MKQQESEKAVEVLNDFKHIVLLLAIFRQGFLQKS